MAEYIEREAALDIFGDVPMWQGYYESYPWEVHCAIVGIVKLVKEEIGKIPTSDVAPVVHGEWLLRHEGCGHYWECSSCHKNPCIYVTKDTRYCPNCGAKMDKEDEDDV